MMKMEKPPTMIIKAPLNYEIPHELLKCPLCNNPNPILDMYIPVREYGYFDINLYTCSTICGCGCGRAHMFSVKHEILTDAQHLKVYDRTHVEDVW
jgi:hypothetical protein